MALDEFGRLLYFKDCRYYYDGRNSRQEESHRCVSNQDNATLLTLKRRGHRSRHADVL